MSPKYDLFERFPDGSSLWRACVIGLEGTRQHMQDLALRSPNQFYAMHVGTGRIVLLERGPVRTTVLPRIEKQSKAAAA